MGPVNEPIFDRNENNFIREGWGGKRWEEKGRRGMGREGGGGKGKERDWERRGGEEKGRRGIGREGGRKDSVPVQNKQKTKQNKSNNPQAHGMSA